jgi:glycosyltransferase involved in cell wall biosynthesis
MRVLHVIPSVSAIRGGPSAVLRTITKALAANGVIVDVVTTNDDGRGLLPEATSNSPISIDGVTYRFFPRDIRFYTVSWALTRWLRDHCSEYDLVHIHALFSYPSIAAAFCARRAGVPYVVRPLGVLNRWGMTRRRPWLKKLSFRFLESRVIRDAAGIHYTSEQESAEAAELGVKHISLIVPNPVDISDETPIRGQFRAAHPALQGKTIVLFLSRIDAKKGIDLLLPAFARAQVSHPSAVLVVAGDGDLALVEKLKAQARGLGLGENVLWAGFLQGANKRGVLADADVFVLPSYSENFGVAVVEALGTGLPVIVSDQVGIHADIERAEAGLIVECSEEPLALALSRLIEDMPLRNRLAANARKLAQRYSPTVVATELERVYKTILRNEVREFVH